MQAAIPGYAMTNVMEPFQRILVVKLATLGDLLTATPALRAIRTSFPAAHVAVLTTPGSAAVLRGLDSVDEVITFDKFAFDRPPAAAAALPRALRLAARLRAGRWDALLFLHHLTTPFGVAKYAALALSSGAPIRAGLDNGRGRLFLTHHVPDHGFGWKHEADYGLDVAAALGARHPSLPRLEIAIAHDDEEWADRTLAAHPDRRPLALLFPGSGAFSVARRWSPARFVEVAHMIRSRLGLQPLVLCGQAEDEKRLAIAVADGFGDTSVPGRGSWPVGVVGPAPSPGALAALLRRCAVLVANDSGPVHLAAAVGTPVVALFGPTNAAAWGPYPADDPHHGLVREQLVCAPCIHRGHELGTPDGCPARTCLALISPDAVIDAVERVLGPVRPAAFGRDPGGVRAGAAA